MELLTSPGRLYVGTDGWGYRGSSEEAEEAEGKTFFEIRNPANGRVICQVGEQRGVLVDLKKERLRGEVPTVWDSAEAFGPEDVLDPRETRQVIYRWLDPAFHSQRPGIKPGPGNRG